MEIFYQQFGQLPKSVYDTQIAAMVCGFGDQVSYEQLVNRLLNIKIDKSSRVSNWSFRPLSEKQIQYALSDVTHLVKVYEILKNEISIHKRELWIKEEMESLAESKNYEINTEESWKKLKIKSTKRTTSNTFRALSSLRSDAEYWYWFGSSTKSIKLIKASGKSTNAIQIAFQAARRAILVCGSKGLELPPEKYEEWKIITIIFDPRCKKIEVSPGVFEGCDH